MTTTTITDADRRLRIESAIEAGKQICRDNGVDAPSLGDAIWELFIEAAETLRRLPDRERAWLANSGRSSMPEIMRSRKDMDSADPDAMDHQPPPRKEAIDRMEEVLSWFQMFSPGRDYKKMRDLQVVFSLASGLPHHMIAARARVSTGHLPRIRDRQITAVAFELRRLLRG